MQTIQQERLDIALTTPTLEISGGAASPLIATGVDCDVRVDGMINTLTAGNCDALSFEIQPGKTRIVGVYADLVGNITYNVGSEFDNETYVSLDKAPHQPKDTALLGYAHIQNGSTAVFTAGIDNLDAANITTTFLNKFTTLGK